MDVRRAEHDCRAIRYPHRVEPPRSMPVGLKSCAFDRHRRCRSGSDLASMSRNCLERIGYPCREVHRIRPGDHKLEAASVGVDDTELVALDTDVEAADQEPAAGRGPYQLESSNRLSERRMSACLPRLISGIERRCTSDLNDNDVQQRTEADRRQVDPPIQVKTATRSKAGQLDRWVTERQEWRGRVRGADGRHRWIRAVDLRPAGGSQP